MTFELLKVPVRDVRVGDYVAAHPHHGQPAHTMTEVVAVDTTSGGQVILMSEFGSATIYPDDMVLPVLKREAS